MASKKQRRIANTAQAREAARAEAARLAAVRKAKDRRRRTTLIGSIVGGVALTAILVVVIVMVFSKASDPAALESRPAGATSNGGIVVGKGGVAGGEAPSGEGVVTMDIYSDYICPYCGSLETALSEPLKELVDNGEVRLVVHPLAFLDEYSNDTKYSSRASNAAATVAAKAPEQFWDFHTALFENQPAEGTDGLDDATIADLATGVGVSEEVAATIADGSYATWVQDASKRAVDDGITGTPAVYFKLGDGKPQQWKSWSNGALQKAIDAVKAGGTPDDGQ